MKLPGFRIGICVQKVFESARLAIFNVMGKKSADKTWKHKQVYEDDEVSAAKRQKLDDDDKECFSLKRKVAMMLMYSGKGYLGMQRNPGYPTIEEDLLTAFVKAGIVRPDHIEKPGAKMSFQRAARTDKGVSAAGQVISFKMLIDTEDGVKKINENLPDQIKVFGWKRVTKGFDSKNNCSGRTYTYVTPTFAFAPITENVTESYRITKDVLEEIQRILDIFCGTRNFHNYTSGKKSSDPSAHRYIMDFKVGEPFVRDNIEYVTLTIKGQSFMIHQIRKMSGMVMAVCRGFATIDTIKRSWNADKLDIPKAPPLGLVLDQIHYDTYNKKFGSDGIHAAIDWSEFREEMNEFKEKYIYSSIYKTEKEEKSMMKWLLTLNIHHYGVIDQSLDRDRGPMYRAKALAEGKDDKLESKMEEKKEEDDEEAVKEMPVHPDESIESHGDEKMPIEDSNDAKTEEILENKEGVSNERTENEEAASARI